MHDHDDPDDGSDSDGIEYERSTFEHGAEPWKDPEVLRRLYHDKGLTQREIADEFGCTQPNISHWLRRLGIETRTTSETEGITKEHRDDGRVRYHMRVGDGDVERFFRYELVALLEFDPSVVFADDTHIHHDMGSPYVIDHPTNLDVLGRAEHTRLHNTGAACHPREFLRQVFDLDDDADPLEGADSDGAVTTDDSDDDGTADEYRTAD